MQQKRLYEAGQSTMGWKRVGRLQNLKSVKVGDRLIMVRDDYKAENLIMVTKMTEDSLGERISWQYVKPDSTRRTGNPKSRAHFIRDIDLAGANLRVFRAVRQR